MRLKGLVVAAVLAATGSALGVTTAATSASPPGTSSGSSSGYASVHLLAQGSPAPTTQRPASSRWTGVTGLSV